MRSHTFFAAALTAFLVMPAHADNVTIVRSAAPVAKPDSTATVDVTGVRLGASMNGVRAVLQKQYGKPNGEGTSGIQRDINGIRIETAPYPYQVKYSSSGKGYESFTATFASPALGGIAVGFLRSLSYRDPEQAPDAKAVQDQLNQKYGPPSRTHSNGNVTELYWVKDKTGRTLPCKGACSAASVDTNPALFSAYQKRVANGEAFLIRVFLIVHRTNKQRLSSLDLYAEDVTDEALDLGEAFKQMDAFAEKKSHQRSDTKVRL